MKIAELQDGTTVSFELFIANNKFDFPSVVHFQKKGNAYFEPIRIGEKILNIQDEKVRLNLIYSIEGKKPIIWADVDVHPEVYKKKVFYQIEANVEGKTYNRRGAYRQYVGDEVFAKIGSGMPDVQVVLKDISNTGFSFVYRDDIKDSDHAMVFILYTYKDEQAQFELTLSGKVVRKQKLEDGRTLYGCVLVRKSEMIAKFVNYKQKEQLTRMNASAIQGAKK